MNIHYFQSSCQSNGWVDPPPDAYYNNGNNDRYFMLRNARCSVNHDEDDLGRNLVVTDVNDDVGICTPLDLSKYYSSHLEK